MTSVIFSTLIINNNYGVMIDLPPFSVELVNEIQQFIFMDASLHNDVDDDDGNGNKEWRTRMGTSRRQQEEEELRLWSWLMVEEMSG